jgi:hypothetical protein
LYLVWSPDHSTYLIGGQHILNEVDRDGYDEIRAQMQAVKQGA